MSDVPSGIEKLFLWRLAVAGGGDWKKDIKPALESAPRKRLIKSGLIEETKRKPSDKGRSILYCSLTDRGWAWLGDHLGEDINTRSPAALEILVQLLHRMQVHLSKSELTLAEFINSSQAGGSDPDNLPERVYAVYLVLAGGKENVRVRLADLREALPEVSREVLDRTLLKLAEARRGSLFPLDNPLEITGRDRDAVLRTPSGDERHVVYLGGGGV